MKRHLTLATLLVGVGSWQLLSKQQKADMKGSLNSVNSSLLAFWVLGKAIYNYQMGLRGLENNSEEYIQQRSLIHSETAELLLDLSQRNRGLYLKFGQYLGNLERVIPKQYTNVLKSLQDTAPSLPYQEIKTVIEEDLDQNPFQNFEESAFSAASLAQVHRATLPTGEKVVVKLQYTYLRRQTKWDLIVMQKISEICNFLIKSTQYKELNVEKLFKVWTSTIEEQLDFTQELKNGEKTAELFEKQSYVHVPKFYPQFCTKRMIVMEEIQGAKINDIQKITNQLKLDPIVVSQKLMKIMAKMIFKFGFVHCDAHPGNIFVRRSQKQGSKEAFEIVLLDHGMYKNLDREFVDNFANLWLSLLQSNEKNVKIFSQRLGISKHMEYLPLLFMYRTRESNKKIGDPLTEQERKYFKEKGLRNFDDIAQFIQDLPSELMFVIRASNLVALHNLALGGTRRERLLEYGRQCARNIYGDFLWSQYRLLFRIWIFQHLRWLHNLIFP